MYRKTQSSVGTIGVLLSLSGKGFFTNVVHGEYQAVIGRTVIALHGGKEVVITGFSDSLAKDRPCTVRWKRLSKGRKTHGVLPMEKVRVIRAEKEKSARIIPEWKKAQGKYGFKKGFPPPKRGERRA